MACYLSVGVWKSSISLGSNMCDTGSQVASDSGYPTHLTKYWTFPSRVRVLRSRSALKIVSLSMRASELVSWSLWLSGEWFLSVADVVVAWVWTSVGSVVGERLEVASVFVWVAMKLWDGRSWSSRQRSSSMSGGGASGQSRGSTNGFMWLACTIELTGLLEQVRNRKWAGLNFSTTQYGPW